MVALKLGVTPATGLLFVSSSVIVTVLVATPFATTGPVPLIVEFAATTELEMNCTVVVSAERLAGVTTVRVLVCATVEAIVPEVWPLAFVATDGCTSVLPVPVDEKLAV